MAQNLARTLLLLEKFSDVRKDRPNQIDFFEVEKAQEKYYYYYYNYYYYHYYH